MKNTQKRKLSILLLLALLVGLLAGCKEEKPGDTQDNVQSAYRTMMGSVFTDAGYYYLDNGVLNFFDFSSGQSVCLCSRAGCKHEDPQCDAYMPGASFSPFFVWEDHLYYVDSYMNSEEMGEMLYRRNLDGTGLFEVGVLCEEFIKEKKEISVNYFVAFNGKLYYGAEILGRPEPGHVAFENFEGSVLRSMDLKTGKEETLLEHKEARLTMWAISGDLLIYDERHIPRNYRDPDHKEQMLDSPIFLRQYNLTSGENKLLKEKKIKDGLNCKWVKGSLLYLAYKVDEQAAIWSIYDLQTGEETVRTDVEGLTFINEKYALRYDSEKKQKYIYDIKAQKDLPMEFVSLSIPAKNENHMIIRKTTNKPDSDKIAYSTFYYVPVEALADGLQASDCTEVYKRYNGAQG